MSDMLRYLSDLHIEAQRLNELVNRKVDGTTAIAISPGAVHIYYGIELLAKAAGQELEFEELQEQGKYAYKVKFVHSNTVFFQILTFDEYDMFTHGLAGQIKVAPELVV